MNELIKTGFRRKFLLIFIPILALILLIDNNYALAAGTKVFSFLTIGAGARPAGMGEAFVGLTDDVNSIYWNCAGLGRIKRTEITSSYMQYVADIYAGYIGFALPVKKG